MRDSTIPWRSGRLTGPVETVRDLLKHTTLLVPVDQPNDGPKVPLIETADVRQKEKLFLNIGSEVEELHDLGHAGSRYSAQSGEFGIVANRFLSQQPVKPEGQRHKPSDPGNRADSDFANGPLGR